MGVRAKLKLTNTQSTDQPTTIIAAKGVLKVMKKFGSEIEEIATNLYLSQSKSSQLRNLLCDKLTAMHIESEHDKFPIFMNNMGRVAQDLNGEYQQYLLNMHQHLVNPLNEFNNGSIRQCKQLKLRLRRKKGEYDMIFKEQNKLRSRQHRHNVNLANVHDIRRKSKMKLEKLELIRDAFLSSIQSMEAESVSLLSSMKQFMGMYGDYSKVVADKLDNIQKESMHYVPANMNNRLDLGMCLRILLYFQIRF